VFCIILIVFLIRFHPVANVRVLAFHPAGTHMSSIASIKLDFPSGGLNEEDDPGQIQIRQNAANERSFFRI